MTVAGTAPCSTPWQASSTTLRRRVFVQRHLAAVGQGDAQRATGLRRRCFVLFAAALDGRALRDTARRERATLCLLADQRQLDLVLIFFHMGVVPLAGMRRARAPRI